MHAEDDQTMPWNQTEELFRSTLAAATKATPDASHSNLKAVDLGEAGRHETWVSDAIRVEKLVAKYGGHNTFLTLAPISLAILQLFGLAAETARL
ncbi:hypothetical protein P153DRAFT_54744 [Dothidotthia symphoricarpi CBS 119687]|uniref:Uncharacterized protein n=1 Tax=Dothidotthia symphoricarpi CBS 119687 TaxID=1392245 RepID=A0A6A6A792_9PLEO|nr:uncharacterized protein P153DRAFT_54744 [Dothidotthia symphoricarpi CBS 119687]KAF2127749.1 hypothetical protein P153DRAFT_54744 [Dothidotthia symphoricarpi CBS 119687]